MSAAPLPSNTPELDPSLTTPQPDYRAVHFNDDGSPFIADRYANLCSSTQLYVLALARIGTEESLAMAQRVADCCRSGHVSKRCKRGKFAIAHRHHCGDMFCRYDSSGRYRFNKWAAKRNPVTFETPHEGLEIRFRNHKPELNTHKKKMYALRSAANKFLAKISENTVSVTTFAEKVADDSIRAVFPGKGAYSYTRIKAILTELGFDNLTAVIKRGTPGELFHWAFNGFHDLAAMRADEKAHLRVSLVKYHTISTTGKLYEALPKDQWQKIEDAPCVCPVCKDHDLDSVPIEERFSQRVEDIQDEYEQVDWSREHLSPFLVRRDIPTNKSVGDQEKSPTVVALDTSPKYW